MRTVTLHPDRICTGPLILVNAAHPLRDPAQPCLVPPDPRYPQITMERQAARLLSAALQAADPDGAIVPVSGWRSQAQQQAIWDDTLKTEGEAFTRQYVALPGCSEHQTGLAMDLALSAPEIDFIRPYFPQDGVCALFRRLAPRYGFIQRYRRHKEALTGIAEEPWHFRYVGTPHARLMEENGLCLEEYGAFVQRNTPICLEEHGRKVRVTYLPCPHAPMDIALPDGCCQLSGDNVGGFFLTVWGDAP